MNNNVNEYTAFSVDESKSEHTTSIDHHEKNQQRWCPCISFVRPKQFMNAEGGGTCSEIASLLVFVLFVGTFTAFIIHQFSPTINNQGDESKHDIIRYKWVQQLSSSIGYSYFLSWALAALPQIILNFSRKTTIGLSIDANIIQALGLACYTIYNIAMYWSETVKSLYSARHEGKPNRVDGNDLAFSIYGLMVSTVIVCQILFYAHKNQNQNKITETVAKEGTKYYQMDITIQNEFELTSNQNVLREKSSLPSGIKPAKSTLYYIALVSITIALYVYGILNYGATIDESSSSTGLQKYLNWLDFCYALSSIKVISVTLKYIPQVVLNYKRKSTKGFSIWTVVLDMNGGLLSILQLILDCWNAHDWDGILGNLAKFMVGFISVVFNVSERINLYFIFAIYNLHSMFFAFYIISFNTSSFGLKICKFL